jgi:hypothetical protein
MRKTAAAWAARTACLVWVAVEGARNGAQARTRGSARIVARFTEWFTAWIRARVLPRGMRGARADAGMVTSEYAMGIIAAVAFAAVLYKVVTSGEVSSELQGIVKKALGAHV